MVVTLDKYDLDSVNKYLFELMGHIHEKSKGDIKMVFIAASYKTKEINHIMAKGNENDAARLLLMALYKLAEDFPEIGVTIDKINI